MHDFPDSSELRSAVLTFVLACVAIDAGRNFAEGFDLASVQKLHDSGFRDFAEAEVLARMYAFR